MELPNPMAWHSVQLSAILVVLFLADAHPECTQVDRSVIQGIARCGGSEGAVTTGKFAACRPLLCIWGHWQGHRREYIRTATKGEQSADQECAVSYEHHSSALSAPACKTLHQSLF